MTATRGAWEAVTEPWHTAGESLSIKHQDVAGAILADGEVPWDQREITDNPRTPGTWGLGKTALSQSPAQDVDALTLRAEKPRDQVPGRS